MTCSKSAERLTPSSSLDDGITVIGLPIGFNLENRYHIERVLGRGGMGKVYLATDAVREKKVAIKVVHDQLSRDPGSIRRLIREANLSMELSHPDIVRVNNFEDGQAVKFLVMEYVEGETLADRIARNERLSEEETRAIGIRMCRGLEHAHEKHVIHRDLKPGNVLLGIDGSIKVADFGIARAARDSLSRLTSMVDSGTLLYMSPEHLDGQTNELTDIYSLGVVLYEMLSGEPPFQTGDIPHQIRYKAPPPIAGVSPEMMALVLRCMEKDAGKRFASVREVRAALSGESEKAPLPKLEVPTEPLRFQVLDGGPLPRRMLVCRNAGGGELRGVVSSSVPWLDVTPTVLEGVAAEQRIDISLRRPPGLARGSTLRGEISFDTTGGAVRVPVIAEKPAARFPILAVAIGAAVVAALTIVIWIVSHLGSSTPQPLEVTLEPDREVAEAGSAVRLLARVRGAESGKLAYRWETTAGRIEGVGEQTALNTAAIETKTDTAVVVTVTVTSGDGAGGSARKTITVRPPARTLPALSVSASPKQARVGTRVALSAICRGLDARSTTYQWSSNIGTIAGSGPNVTLQTSPSDMSGPVEIAKVSAFARDGASHEAQASIEVEIRGAGAPPLPALPAFSVVITPSITAGHAGDTVMLTASAAAEIVASEWWVSDGILQGEGLTRTLVLGKSSSTEVRVKLTDNNGLSATGHLIIPVEAANRSPEIQDLRMPAGSVRLGEAVELAVSASDPDNDALQYLWTTSVGSLDAKGPQATLGTAGIKISGESMRVTVTVTVKDGRGGVNSTSRRLTVLREAAGTSKYLSAWMDGPETMLRVEGVAEGVTGKAGSIDLEVRYVEGTPQVVFAGGQIQLLPGVPCRVSVERLTNVSAHGITEAPGPTNKWARIRLRFRPETPGRPAWLSLTWQTVP